MATKRTCIDCGKPITANATRCRAHAAEEKRDNPDIFREGAEFARKVNKENSLIAALFRYESPKIPAE